MPTRRHRTSRLPVGTQFSPQLVDLHAFLTALVRAGGDEASLLDAIWRRPVRLRLPSRKPTKRRRRLPLEAARQYGLADKGSGPTELACALQNLTGTELYRAFGSHCLRNLGGMAVIEAILEMRRDPTQRAITGDSLAAYLTRQKGFPVGEHNTQINSFRMWLAKAGVFAENARSDDGWIPNMAVVESLIGLDQETMGLLAAMEMHQLAFIRALCATADKPEYVAADVRALAEARDPSVRFDRGSLPLNVLEPLKQAGLIDYRTLGTGGGKSSRLTLTPKFRKDVLESFVANTVKDLDPLSASYFRKAPAEIFSELRSRDRQKKGRALEALTIRLMRLLGLRFLSWNRRAADTGYAEVDAVFAGVFGAVPTRWQIQCKNVAKKVPLEDVAKEVGLTLVTGATHILFLANANFTREALKFAEEVMRKSPLTLYLLGKADFDALVVDDARLGSILREKAESAVRAADAKSLFAWR
jgi:Restriction endonuclease